MRHLILWGLLPWIASSQINTSNTQILTYPPLPKLPAAGGIFLDPTFGTRILRVTDAVDGLNCGDVYSYWPSFNKTVTRLLAACTVQVSTWTEETAVFYVFDPKTLGLSGKVTKTSANSRTPTGETVDLSGAIWSGQDPDALFAVNATSTKLWGFNIQKNVFTLVKDLAPLIPGKYPWQIQRSMDDDRFSFTLKNSSDFSTAGYAVFSVKENRILYRVDTTSVDEVQIDKSGRYLVVKTGNSGATVVEGKIVDLQTGKVTDLVDGAPDFNLGHSDNGASIQVGEENWTPAILRRDLTNPHSATSLLTMTWATAAGGHYSMLADGDAWVLISSAETKPQPTVRMEGEAWLLATDGSQRVWRFAHPRSVYSEYYDFPRANLSRDAKFAAFTSNWGGSSRQDLFVAETGLFAPEPVPSQTCFSVTVTKDGKGNTNKKKIKQACAN